MFSYGSGLASSMFSLELSNDDGLLERLVERLSDVAPRLERRIRVPAADFVDILKRNEETHHKGGSSDIPRLAGTASFDRLGVVCVCCGSSVPAGVGRGRPAAGVVLLGGRGRHAPAQLRPTDDRWLLEPRRLPAAPSDVIRQESVGANLLLFFFFRFVLLDSSGPLRVANGERLS